MARSLVLGRHDKAGGQLVFRGLAGVRVLSHPSSSHRHLVPEAHLLEACTHHFTLRNRHCEDDGWEKQVSERWRNDRCESYRPSVWIFRRSVLLCHGRMQELTMRALPNHSRSLHDWSSASSQYADPGTTLAYRFSRTHQHSPRTQASIIGSRANAPIEVQEQNWVHSSRTSAFSVG